VGTSPPSLPGDHQPPKKNGHTTVNSTPKAAIMAIITATILLRTISIFHITVGYYLLFSPSTIADQNLVYILGAAMDIVRPPPHYQGAPPPRLPILSSSTTYTLSHIASISQLTSCVRTESLPSPPPPPPSPPPLPPSPSPPSSSPC